MGSSSSKASITQNITNLQVTQSDIELLNEQVNTFISKNIIENASSCSSSSAQTVNEEIGNIVAKGPGSSIKIGSDVDQKTNITLECLQESLQQSNINNSMASSIMTELTNNVSADTMAKLISKAESSSETGFANPLAFADSDSKINTNINNTQLNYQNKKLENIIKNSVENITKNKNVSECGTSISQHLNRKVKDVIATDGGTIDLTWKTSQIVESIAKCKQLNKQVADVTTEIINSFGVKVVETQQQKSSSQSQSEGVSSAKTQGVGDVLGAMFAALMGPYALSSIGICCCIIILCIVVYFFMKSGGSSDNNNTTGEENDEEPEEKPLAIKSSSEEETEEQEGGYKKSSYKGYFIKKFLDGIKENRKIHKW